MNRYVMLLLVGLIDLSLVQAQSFTGKKLRERTLELLHAYDPEGYEIVTSYESAPSEYKSGGMTVNLGKASDFSDYLSGTSENAILEGINTVVHETNHGYTSRLVYLMLEKEGIPLTFEEEYYAYYIGSGAPVLVQLTPTFPSRKFAGSIPKEFRTFRFDTYIKDAPEVQSTQQHGIYGLLDELNSYYHGTKTSVCLYEYYRQERKFDGEEWIEWMQDVDGTLFAYQEFRFYILNYLIYAEKNYPDEAEHILANGPFLLAYAEIISSYQKLVDNYVSLREKLLSELGKSGYPTELTDEYTFIGSRGGGNFRDVYKLLENELKKEPYARIDRQIHQALEKSGL